jgi:DNA mismatch repair protein MutS2
LKKRRHDLAEKVIEQYEEEFKQLREKFETTLKKVKTIKDKESSKRELSETLGDLKKGLSRLEDEHVKKQPEPGEPAVFERLKKGDQVYITRFKKMGRVLRRGKSQQEKIEVEIGSLKFQVLLKELRIVPRADGNKPHQLLQYKPKKETVVRSGEKAERILVIPSATNTLDLRGLAVDDAMGKTWKFMDAAVMRGEYAVLIIHGHGTHTLKQAIRKALESESPYDIDFYPGSPVEGGDGVTVIYFKRDSD